MLTDPQSTNATSSFEMSRHDERALKEINAPRGEERRRIQIKIICSPSVDANTSHAISARETIGKPQIVRKPSDWMVGSLCDGGLFGTFIDWRGYEIVFHS